MFGSMPSRGGASFHGRSQSRFGTRRKHSDHDNNKVRAGMEMVDLEDSSNDPLAESRNMVKIKSLAVPMSKRKTVK